MEGWSILPLGRVSDFEGGSQPPKSEFSLEPKPGYVRLLQIRDFKSDKHAVYIAPTNKTRMCNADDIMIGRYGASVGQIHRGKAGSYNVALIKTIPDPSTIDRDYFYYYLTSDLFQARLASVADRSAQAGFSKEDISSFPVPVPPLAEQKRIVAILDEAFEGIDKAIANTEKNLANANELFESYLASKFDALESNCPRRRIGDMAERVTKGSSPKWQGINYVDEPGVLFVTSENVDRHRMLLEKKKFVEESFNQKDSKSILQRGDVLTNIVGASIGRTAIYDRDDLANINQAVCLIRCVPDELYNKYLCYLLNSQHFVDLLHDNEVDNARANLSLTFFRDLQIPAPSREAQVGFVNEVDEFWSATDALQRKAQAKLEALREFKKSILSRAFSGQLSAALQFAEAAA